MQKIIALLFCFVFSLTTLAESLKCQNEIKEHCQDQFLNKATLVKCLEDNESDLSQVCSQSLKNYKKEILSKNPCFNDILELCSAQQGRPGKTELCLLKNESKLSQGCFKDFQKKKVGILKNDACTEDTINHCSNELSLEDGMVTRCLFKNVEKLKPNCQSKTKQRMTQMKLKNPCFDDTEKYCPMMVKIFDIDQCLEKQLIKLSPNCQVMIKEEQQRSKNNPCHQDIKKHCKPGISVEGVNRCLEINQSTLSKACVGKRKEHFDKISKRAQRCEKDRQKLCPKVPAKSGAILDCLREKKSQVSKECQEVL